MQIFSDELHDKVTDLIDKYKKAMCQHEMDLVEVFKSFEEGVKVTYIGGPMRNYESCKKGCGFWRYL